MIFDMGSTRTIARPPALAGTAPTRMNQRAGHHLVDERLTAHLQAWLGAWPPVTPRQIIVWPGRDQPGWDGGMWLGLGVESPLGTVFSVSPGLIAESDHIGQHLIATALSAPDPDAVSITLGWLNRVVSRAAFRWSDGPADLPDIGEWVPSDDPRLPAWLRPFNGDALIAWDDGQVAAGVGIKRHNRYGHDELAVVTEPGYQGRGLARLLVAQAARRVLADGAVPLYLHLPDNVASARVADAAGFPDRGWRVLGLH